MEGAGGGGSKGATDTKRSAGVGAGRRRHALHTEAMGRNGRRPSAHGPICGGRGKELQASESEDHDGDGERGRRIREAIQSHILRKDDKRARSARATTTDGPTQASGSDVESPGGRHKGARNHESNGGPAGGETGRTK